MKRTSSRFATSFGCGESERLGPLLPAPFLPLRLPKAAIWEAWCFVHWRTILGPWGHPCGPLQRQKRQVGLQNPIFCNTVTMLEPHFEHVLGTQGSSFVFPGCFQAVFEFVLYRHPGSLEQLCVWEVSQAAAFRRSRFV